MKNIYILAVGMLLGSVVTLQAQKNSVKGVVLDSAHVPIPNVLVMLLPDSIFTVTNKDGEFDCAFKSIPSTLICNHLNYYDYQSSNFSIEKINKIILLEKIKVLSTVSIKGNKYKPAQEIGNIDVDAKSAYFMPSATGDFSKVIATLPGVVSTNELSSTYTVRGGNYDENLIYVNGIKIYRPFLIGAGRQEGLGFVNQDLVGGVQFSAGGWQARYGDKLSSVLNVQYLTPTKNEATINASILGGSLYFGGINSKKDFTYTVGIRHKNSKSLLRTLEVKGEYSPIFTDIQSYITKRFSSKTKLGLLISTASNQYRVTPKSQVTEFGTINNAFRLTVAFQGKEQLHYDTQQLGAKLTHSFTDRWISTLTISKVLSSERENFEVEGGYRLCDINNNPGSNNFNECTTIRGIGTHYNYGRNKLEANITTIDQRNEIVIGDNLIEFGVSWDHEKFDDRVKEYAFTDSADYSKITRSVSNQINIDAYKLAAFAQYTFNSDNQRHLLNIGGRINYWTFSEEWLISPRFQYAYYGGSNRNTVFRLSAGMYHQHPFYRELRDRSGTIRQDVKAQKSTHIVAGVEHFFEAWGRPFKLTADTYYKYMWDVNPYDINNVRIRYFGTNQATAYAYGVDLRVNGEFISGVESWFSLGLLSTQENLGDGKGYIRRPSDQRLNMAIFFQDHIPNDPSLKVNINLQVSSKFPFGPPDNDELRNKFRGATYKRLDVGFSKSLTFEKYKLLIPNSLRIGLEVLNILGVNNTISYIWIQDVGGNYFAVPNGLSARFLNLRLIAKF